MYAIDSWKNDVILAWLGWRKQSAWDAHVRRRSLSRSPLKCRGILRVKLPFILCPGNLTHPSHNPEFIVYFFFLKSWEIRGISYNPQCKHWGNMVVSVLARRWGPGLLGSSWPGCLGVSLQLEQQFPWENGRHPSSSLLSLPMLDFYGS